MTIALIGKEDSVRSRARVGLISPQGSDGLAEAIGRVGHDAIACTSWSTLSDGSDDGPIDLVLCHESCLADLPPGWATPVVRIDDTTDVSEEALSPLLAMAVELATKVRRIEELEAVVAGIRSGSALLGNTPVMRRLQSAVARAADSDATVLVEGPSGSGKSLAARVVHLKSRRCDQRLMVHDCASLSAEELGRAIGEASLTTLILESVDQLSAAAQSVLVKHLKERSTSRTRTEVRLIATTSAHIPELVARGSFREDLFYRLHSFPIVVPGLHERSDDIGALADYILEAGVSSSSRVHQGFTAAARTLLASMNWPGNVAQLEATIRRGQVIAGGSAIDRDHLLEPVAPNSGAMQRTAPAASGDAVTDSAELTEESIRPFEEEEKFLLGRALQATKGNVRRAAQLLGIGRATLYRKIQQYHLRLH